METKTEIQEEAKNLNQNEESKEESPKTLREQLIEDNGGNPIFKIGEVFSIQGIDFKVKNARKHELRLVPVEPKVELQDTNRDNLDLNKEALKRRFLPRKQRI